MDADRRNGLARLAAGRAGAVRCRYGDQGWTFAQFCQEVYECGHEQFVEEANDPNSVLAQEFDRRDFPFGKDPWLTRSEP